MKEVEEITINNLEEVEETDPYVVAQPSIMNNTEKLVEIDISIIANPSINKSKRWTAKEREEEIIQDAETNNKKVNSDIKKQKQMMKFKNYPKTN